MSLKFNRESLDVRVIIKPEILQNKYKGPLDLSAVSERTQAINTDRGEIVMIGPNAWFDKPQKPDIKPGDKVYYSKYGAKVLKDETTNELYVICNDEDILVAYGE